MKTDSAHASSISSKDAPQTGAIGPDVAAAYNASNVTFRVLRTFGWGPLVNLGYYPFGKPLTLLNFLVTPFVIAPFFRLPAAQMRLVKKSVALLDLHSARRVLDVGCGRGASSFVMAHAFPHANVTAIDLLPENVAVARTLYANTPNLSYRQGDAADLDFPDRSFDRVLCLEAAFQFRQRARFMSELGRVVDAGGRVVIVDFMWKNDEARDACNDERTRLVQRTWQWESFDSVGEYRRNAQANGFTVEACLDWSSHVTAPLRTIFALVAGLAEHAWSRALLMRYHPLLRSLGEEDWQEFARSALAHQHVHRYVQYNALVLTRGSRTLKGSSATRLDVSSREVVRGLEPDAGKAPLN
jgi:ubiquinone/menaquinone biosynthesis C-methylase UbiE